MDMACPYSASFWHYTDFDNFCKGFRLKIFKFLIQIRKDLDFFYLRPPAFSGLFPWSYSGTAFHMENDWRIRILPSFEKKTPGRRFQPPSDQTQPKGERFFEHEKNLRLPLPRRSRISHIIRKKAICPAPRRYVDNYIQNHIMVYKHWHLQLPETMLNF